MACRRQRLQTKTVKKQSLKNQSIPEITLIKKFFVLTAVFLLTLMIMGIGCDFSARSDLRKAEKAMNEADMVKAEHYAEKEYRRAQKAFDLAMMYERDNQINQARDHALEAKEWAEEAVKLSIKRIEELEKEQEEVGSYKE